MSKKMSKKKTAKKTGAYVPRSWTQEEEQRLLFMRRGLGYNYKLIATDLDRTIDSCKKKYCDTIWKNREWYSTWAIIEESFKKSHLERIARLQDKRGDLQKVRMDIVADRIETAVTSIPSVPRPFVSRKKKEHSPEDVGLIFGDAHIGHTHTLEETGGISEYNVEIFQKRVNNLKNAVTDIYELHSKLYKLPTLHIFSVGDIVAGMNNSGAWSSIYISSDIHEQVILGCEAFATLIHSALHLFDNVVFYGVYGNHGRGALRGAEKEHINWDFICYEYLSQRFRDNKRVSFVVPKTWWLLETIRKHKFLIMHGEDIRCSGGIPLAGVIKAQNNMMTILKEIPDYSIIGHFHATGEWTTNNGKILTSGSFMGPDIYALKNLVRGAKPEQTIFGIHDKRGITWRYDIDLDIER